MNGRIEARFDSAMRQSQFASMTGREFRDLCRREEYTGPTAGVAVGFAQANLVILRADAAAEFEEFCRLNPRPCPLLEMTRLGWVEPVACAPGADLRTDAPRYRVFRDGECVDRPTEIVSYWSENLVSFLIGCSFTFESALQKAGLPVRHIEENRNVPMYRTEIACKQAGRFAGPLVVSMRPMTLSQAETAARVTEGFPRSHGPPIHVGDPERIGVADLSRPDFGDSVTVHPGEVPVFWACGVTPMEAILRAKLEFAVTHEPGHMFVTDLPDSA